MCQMELRDPDTGEPIKMASGVEVNDPYWCACLEAGARCKHASATKPWKELWPLENLAWSSWRGGP